MSILATRLLRSFKYTVSDYNTWTCIDYNVDVLKLIWLLNWIVLSKYACVDMKVNQ